MNMVMQQSLYKVQKNVRLASDIFCLLGTSITDENYNTESWYMAFNISLSNIRCLFSIDA